MSRIIGERGDDFLDDGEPALADQKRGNQGGNLHYAMTVDAIAPRTVISLVLAEHGTQRHQLRHSNQPLAMLVITPIANGA